MEIEKKKRKTISIFEETYDRLQKRKIHVRQPTDEIISDLLNKTEGRDDL